METELHKKKKGRGDEEKAKVERRLMAKKSNEQK